MGKDIAVAEVALVVPAVSRSAGGPEVAGAAVVDHGSRATELLVAEGGQGPTRRGQRGMVSAEWAVGIVAAIAIAGVLLAVITSGEVQDALLEFLLWVIKTFVTVAGG